MFVSTENDPYSSLLNSDTAISDRDEYQVTTDTRPPPFPIPHHSYDKLPPHHQPFSSVCGLAPHTTQFDRGWLCRHPFSLTIGGLLLGVVELLIILAASVVALALCLAVILLLTRARKSRRRRINNSKLNNFQLNTPHLHHPHLAQAPLPQHTANARPQPSAPPLSGAGPGWVPRNFDAQLRKPEPIEQASIRRPLEPTPPEVPNTATSISGEVRQFNAIRAQNGPSLWQFRLERYDSSTGQRLKPIAVEMRYVTKGSTHDGDQVTAHGSFDEAGMFQASELVNHSSRTVVTATNLLGTAKPLFMMMGCYAIPIVIFAVVFLLVIAGAILFAVNQ